MLIGQLFKENDAFLTYIDCWCVSKGIPERTPPGHDLTPRIRDISLVGSRHITYCRPTFAGSGDLLSVVSFFRLHNNSISCWIVLLDSKRENGKKHLPSVKYGFEMDFRASAELWQILLDYFTAGFWWEARRHYWSVALVLTTQLLWLSDCQRQQCDRQYHRQDEIEVSEHLCPASTSS